MLVSIIVPVYNVREYLPRCLDSLAAQTIADREIIIVDDGSTDGSGEIADEFARHTPGVTVIHKENGGLMSAWTTGVRNCNGKYIGFVDSDDYIDMDMYENLIRHAEEHNADMVISQYRINGKDSKHGVFPIAEGLYIGDRLDKEIKMHVFPSVTTYSMSMSRMTKLFRRSLIIDNLKYTESLSRTFEDRYITPAAILSARSIYYTHAAYYNWMLREGSNHGMYKKQLLDDIKRVYGVQRRVVEDICPALMPKWEEAFIDYIRLYVSRNIIRVADFARKLESSRQLLADPIVRDRIKRFGRHWSDKTGLAVKYALTLKMPVLLAFSSYFGSRNC